MSEYLLIVLEDEQAHASQAPKGMADLIEKQAQFEGSLRRAGQLRDAGRLRPSREGKRVKRDGDRVVVSEGPFLEEGRALGSYYSVEAPGTLEAAALGASCPTLARDEVDVRPLMKGRVDPDKEAKPGKIFAFAVLGNAATEEAWVQVMDRIDAETRDGFPAVASLGGLRLEAPKRGKRIAPQGERRATFDGPFLECKEVIGGLFFLRLTSLDEAVRWAAGTRFIHHGALEIRELWRT
ncbi:MAG TPA: YciI family protein [Polyangiaceae bacterium]|jgi:hypothetical protein